MTIATLISNCPAPVSDGTGVTNALTWLATVEAFCMAQDNNAIPTRHTIINYCEICFLETKNEVMTDYSDFNDKLYHIKFLLQGVVASS